MSFKTGTPKEVGMYKRDARGCNEVSDVIYSYWDGEVWRIGDNSPDTPVSKTASGHQDLPWREMEQESSQA